MKFQQHLMDYTILMDSNEPDDDMSDWIRTLSREGQAVVERYFVPVAAR